MGGAGLLGLVSFCYHGGLFRSHPFRALEQSIALMHHLSSAAEIYARREGRGGLVARILHCVVGLDGALCRSFGSGSESGLWHSPFCGWVREDSNTLGSRLLQRGGFWKSRWWILRDAHCNDEESSSVFHWSVLLYLVSNICYFPWYMG